MSFVGKELASLLSDMNTILYESIRDEYQDKRIEVLDEVDSMINKEYLGWVSRLRECMGSNNLHDKAYALLFFDYDVGMPDDLNPYSNIWEIPVSYFEHLQNIEPRQHISNVALENPLTYASPICGLLWDEPDTEFFKVFQKYFKSETELNVIVHFRLISRALTPLRNDNLLLLPVTDMVDWIVWVTREALDCLRYHSGCVGDISEKSTFDRIDHLKMARDAKPNHSTKLKLKALEFFESGQYGANKSKASELMETDLKNYMEENSYKFWPKDYNDFILKRTLYNKKSAIKK